MAEVVTHIAAWMTIVAVPSAIIGLYIALKPRMDHVARLWLLWIVSDKVKDKLGPIRRATIKYKIAHSRFLLGVDEAQRFMVEWVNSDSDKYMGTSAIFTESIPDDETKQLAWRVPQIEKRRSAALRRYIHRKPCVCCAESTLIHRDVMTLAREISDSAESVAGEAPGDTIVGSV